MVPIRFTSLLLGFLLAFVTIDVCIARTQQVMVAAATADGNGFVAFDQVPPMEHIATVADFGKKWFEGRKMMVEDALENVETVKKEGANGGAAKRNSGKDNDAIKKEFHMGMKDQSGTKSIIIAKATPNTSPTKEISEVSSTMMKSSVPQESHDLVQTIESEKFLQATMETMNMLSMDYRDKPRRKPPINNAQPSSEKNHNP